MVWGFVRAVHCAFSHSHPSPLLPLLKSSIKSGVIRVIGTSEKLADDLLNVNMGKIN